MTKAPQQRFNSQNKTNKLPKIISLFSGAGGLDHGFKSAGFELSAAFDISEAAIETHKRNFPGATATAGDLIALGPKGVASIVKAAVVAGSRIGIIGGPPCQGFSRANTTATASDPRNQLPKLYIEIVQELQRHFDVEFVVFENVLGMRDKKHSAAYQSLLSGLRKLGFEITEKELCALDFGVPQTRRRIVLSAIRAEVAAKPVRPRRRRGAATVREAIGSLYEANLGSCIPFQELSAKRYRIGDASSLSKAKKDEKGIQSVFLVGLCKWLLGLSTSQAPPSIMDVKNVVGYRVKPGSAIEDMVSIAIRFNPTHAPIKDPANLAAIPPLNLDECGLATTALRRVSSMLDVDDYLASQEEIRREMTEAMCKLLETARYDGEEYRRLYPS